MLQQLYNSLPVSIQNAAISTYGILWKKRRFGGLFESEYYSFKERENYTPEQWRVYQTDQLRRLLVHAINHVPYYTQVFKRVGLNASELARFELTDLIKLPVLDKNTMRTEGKHSLVSSVREAGSSYMQSSGSTGTPIQVLYSRSMHQRVMAAYESRVRNWAGVNMSMKRATIGGRKIIPVENHKPPYYRINLSEKQLYLSAYHLSQNTANNYREGIIKFSPWYMSGYSSANYLLAKLCDDLNMNMPPMRAVVVSSDKLTQEMRETLARVYGCKVFDAWSGVENCGLISENEYGQLLISPDVGIVEILNDQNEPVKPGETGNVVCTGFLNTDQPLIRYNMGDRVTLAANQVTLCGRHMTVVSAIEGRTEDTITTSDGRKMVRFHAVYLNLKTVVEAQLIQHSLYNYEMLIVACPKVSEADMAEMLKRIRYQLGDVAIQFREVDSIPRGSNGKFKAVISKLTH